MMSTIHQAQGLVIYRPRRNPATIMKPVCVKEYTQYKGGVDRMDQISKYYTSLRRSLKWWRKLAFFLLELAATNAYVLYHKFGDPCVAHEEAMVQLVKQLVAEGKADMLEELIRRPGRPTTTGVAREARLTNCHFCDHIPSQPGANRKHPMRDCVVCNQPKKQRQRCKRKQTTFWCPDCAVVLCVPLCFRLYHTVENYQLAYRRQTQADGDT
ncbi:piggyBac transposable element-derived protein 4-like [Aplysia californica]|uniref:PiggyBac transposable element-derived protein 4-like n=1 Tax=Aplysia californica TaxID=6500 RepID=A0ABM0K2I8_APLCA|nr:piggyBac transposable element-derived protein 4-like [Aplysia californica]